MIKIKGTLLMFDKPDLENRAFPKDCKIRIPDIIPISLVDKTGELLAGPIGHITRTTINESGIAIEGVIICEGEDAYRAVIKENGVYFGGNYKVCDWHEEDGMDIYTSLRLRAVSLFMDDVYGDESLKVEIVEEETAND